MIYLQNYQSDGALNLMFIFLSDSFYEIYCPRIFMHIFFEFSMEIEEYLKANPTPLGKFLVYFW